MLLLCQEVRLYDKVQFRSPHVRNIESSCGEVAAIEPEDKKDLADLFLLFAIPDAERQIKDTPVFA